MNFKRSLLTVMVMIFILSCSDDDEVGDSISASFTVRSIVGEYNFEVCAPELSGFVSAPAATSEYGFVYSNENQEPTLNDLQLAIIGEPDGTQFSGFLSNNFNFGDTLFWRSYAIVEGEVMFGRVLSLTEEYTIASSEILMELLESENLFSVSTECLVPNIQMTVTHNFPCPTEGFVFELCMNSTVESVCEEFPITSQRSTIIPLELDVETVELTLISLAELNRRIFISSDFIPNGELLFEATDLSNMPLAVAESTGFAFGDSFYLCGGYTESSETFTETFWKYDMANDVWEQLEDFPGGPRAFMVSTVVEDIAYIGFGEEDSTPEPDFYSYNLTTNVWKRLADIPFPGSAGISFAIDDNIFVTDLFSFEERLFAYNTTSDSWSELNSVPFDFQNSRNMAVAINGTGYIINNKQQFVANTQEQFADIYQYDAENDQWSLRIEAPISCDDGIAFGSESDNSLYITTGRGMDGIYKLDLESNKSSLSCTSNQDMRSESVGTIFNDKLFIFGGLEHDLDPTNFTRSLNTAYSLDIPN